MADGQDDATVTAVEAAVAEMDEKQIQQMEAGEDLEQIQADGKAPVEDAEEVVAGEEKVEDAEEVEAEAQEEPEAPVMDARLKHAAERAGLTDEFIEGLGDKAPDILTKLADGFDSVSTKMAELGRAKAPQGNPPPSKEDETPKKSETAFDIKSPLDRAKLLDRVDEDGDPVFSDEAIETLTPLFDSFESMRGFISQLNDRVTPYVQEQEARAQSSDWETLESFFEDVTSDYGEVFGKGKTPDLGENSSEFKERTALWEQAKLIAAGHESLGQEFDLKDVLMQSLSITQAGRQKELARQSVREDLKNRGKKITARPRGRAASKTTDPYEVAAEAVAQKVNELGI